MSIFPCSWLEASGTRLIRLSGCPYLAALVPLSAWRRPAGAANPMRNLES